jgi:hypothetical protein
MGMKRRGQAMTWRIALVLLGLGAALATPAWPATSLDSAAVQCPPENPTPGTISAFG